jgi:hypothetical protein
MAKSILLPLQQIHFPASCVVCLSTAPKKYSIQQVFTYGRRSYTIHVDVPMCDAHFAEASYKSLAEKAIGCLGVGVGILAGIAAGILLFVRWVGSGALLLKLFLGVLTAFGIFILVWWLLAIVIALPCLQRAVQRKSGMLYGSRAICAANRWSSSRLSTSK